MSILPGVIDEEFTRMARSNRCGMKDVNNANDMTKRRKKRFALEGSKWHTRDLSWDIKQYTPDMSIQEVDIEVERSFRVSVISSSYFCKKFEFFPWFYKSTNTSSHFYAERHYVFHLLTRFVCLSVCLSVCVSFITFVKRWLDSATRS